MTNDIITIANQAGLAEAKTQHLLKSFGNYFEEARTIAQGAKDINVKDVSETELMLKARKQRLALREVRINVENTRKELKEQSLREGKAIDGIANVIKALIIPIEQHLQLQEDFKKIQDEIARKQLAQSRLEELQKYDFYANDIDLANMTVESYQNLLKNTKEAFEARQEAQKKAEQERIEAEQKRLAEEKRLREENEKLKAESEKREKELAKERAEQQKKLDAERKAREQAEAKVKAEKEAQIKKEQAEKARLDAIAEAEAEAQRKKLLAPDKEKLIDLASSIEKLQLPAVQSKEAMSVIRATQDMIQKMSGYIREKANTL